MNRLHNSEAVGQYLFMGIKKLLFAPLGIALFLWIFVRSVIGLSGPATMREDSESVLKMLWGSFDRFLAWTSAPSTLAATIALFVALAVYVGWLLGYERLLHLSKFIFRKNFREAEYKKIADDDAVKAIRTAILSSRILEQTNWDRTPPIERPPFKSEEEAKQSVIGDYWYDLFQDIPGARVESTLMYLGSDFQSIMDTYKARLNDEAYRAEQDKSAWSALDAGSYFPNEQTRAKWHARQAQIAEENRIMLEIKAILEKNKEGWRNIIDEETQRRLLKDIAKEMRR